VMTDFGALITNANVFYQFPHTVLSGFTTASFFVLGISAYHLVRKKELDFFTRSFRLASIFGLISIFFLIGVGHIQGQHMVRTQPMKMAAAESLWRSENPASLSVFSLIDEKRQENKFSIRVPYLLSFLSYNTFDGEVKGLLDLQDEFVQKYGAGNYIPPVVVSFWSFRMMIGLGFLMLFIMIYALWNVWKKKPLPQMKLLNLLPVTIAFPYLSNTSGWLLTEMGRQPWVVYGVMKTSDAVSPVLTPGMVLTSLIGFSLIYALLMVADAYLLVKTAKAGPDAEGGKKVKASSKAASWI